MCCFWICIDLTNRQAGLVAKFIFRIHLHQTAIQKMKALVRWEIWRQSAIITDHLQPLWRIGLQQQRPNEKWNGSYKSKLNSRAAMSGLFLTSSKVNTEGRTGLCYSDQVKIIYIENSGFLFFRTTLNCPALLPVPVENHPTVIRPPGNITQEERRSSV